MGRGRLGFGAGLVLGFALFAAWPSSVNAQTADLNAEARVFFEEGNRQFTRAMSSRGRRKTSLLRSALQSYMSSLRVVRSRNVLFNAAIVLEELERHDEAFAFWTEYLAIPGLEEEEILEAKKRRDNLREHVAVVSIASEPAGAEVHIDRLDLASRGHTPLEVALPAGPHTVYLSLGGYARTEKQVRAKKGESAELAALLEPLPVALRVETPGKGTLLVDGDPAAVGEALEVAPGRHALRFEREGLPPIERDVRIDVGSDPVTVTLEEDRTRGTLIVRASDVAKVHVDGGLVGQGKEVRVPLLVGTHEVRVAGDGRAPWEGRVRIAGGTTTRVEVAFVAATGGRRTLGRAALFTGIAAGVVGAVGIGLGVRAMNENDKYDKKVNDGTSSLAALRGTRNDVRAANLLADATFAVSGALVATTIIIAVANEDVEQDPSRATVSFGPIRHGAMVRAELPLGAP